VPALRGPRGTALARQWAVEERIMLGTRNAVANVAVKDIARARRFYEGTLGLEKVDEEGEDVIRSSQALIPSEHGMNLPGLSVFSTGDAKRQAGRAGPCKRHALPVPRFVATMARSDFPLPRSGFACARLSRFRLTTEQTGPPKFLDDPRHACPGSTTPVESREQASGNMSLRFAPSMLPSEPTVSSASTTCLFRGPIPQPACSLSTLRGHGCPCAAYNRARLASDWRPCLGRTGFQPAGSLHQVSVVWA
jgi:catechol 2,3-dioxygenase-like lactoylglutathione lyase family enzyme